MPQQDGFAPGSTQHSGFIGRLRRWVSGHHRVAFLLVSAIWVAALYGPCISGPFIYDDAIQIQQNAALTTVAGMHRFLTTAIPFTGDLRSTPGTFYRPLFWLSLALGRSLWGLHPAGFHIVNFALHVANGFLVYLLLRRMAMPRLFSAVVCLVWLVLPTGCEAVAWISGRTYLLCFLFLLLALHSALSWIERPRAALLAAYVCAFLAACLTNEAGVLTLPFTFLLVFAIKGSFRRVRLPLGVAGLGAAAVYLIIRRIAGAHATTGHPALFPIGLSILDYLRLALFPLHLSIDRSTLTPADAASAASIAALAAVLLLAAFAVLLCKRLPAAAFGLLWTLLALLPYSGFIPLYQGMAERYLYIASAGLVLAVAALVRSAPPRPRRVLLALALVWIAGAAVRLHARVLDWTSAISLYEHSVATTPRSPLLQYDLGAAYEEDGDLEEAAAAYHRTLALNSRYADALAGLGNIAYQINEPGAAEQQYRAALAIAPHLRIAWKNLGILLLQQGRTAEAIAALQQAALINSDDPSLDDALGIAYRKSGDLEAAKGFFERALVLNPADPIALQSLRTNGGPAVQ